MREWYRLKADTPSGNRPFPTEGVAMEFHCDPYFSASGVFASLPYGKRQSVNNSTGG